MISRRKPRGGADGEWDGQVRGRTGKGTISRADRHSRRDDHVRGIEGWAVMCGVERGDDQVRDIEG